MFKTNVSISCLVAPRSRLIEVYRLIAEMMEGASTCDMREAAQCNNPEEGCLHTGCRQSPISLKCHLRPMCSAVFSALCDETGRTQRSWCTRRLCCVSHIHTTVRNHVTHC